MHRSVTLYDFELSICCQMTRLVLAEKGVAYDKQHVDIRSDANEQFQPWYVALNPKAVVPTLRVDDIVVTDTLRITQFLDAEFDGPALQPDEPMAAEQMHGWMRDIMAPHYGVLLYGPTVDAEGRSATVMARHDKLVELLETYPESRPVLEKRIEGNRRFQKLLADAEQTAAIVDGVRDLVRSMDAPLSAHEFLAGDAYSIADAFATAALARFEMHGYRDWWSDGALPSVDAYYQRMQARPSWKAAGVYNVESVYDG